LARRCIEAQSGPPRIVVGALKRTLCICSRLVPDGTARLGAPLHRGAIRTVNADRKLHTSGDRKLHTLDSRFDVWVT
jgi:hypothetical protein